MSNQDDVMQCVQALLQAWNCNYQAMPDAVEDGLCALQRAVQAQDVPNERAPLSESIVAAMPKGRQTVLRTLRKHHQGLTDHELALQLQGVMTRSQVKSRRVELVQMGMVYPDGHRLNMSSPAKRNVYKAT